MRDLNNRHKSVQQIMRFFTYDHLPEGLRGVSRECTELAEQMLIEIPHDDPELTAGLRKLLEAKDCFVRAALNG